MTITNAHVSKWRESHWSEVVSKEFPRKLFAYLETFPWGGSQILWSDIPNVSVEFGDGDPQPSWVEKFTDTRLLHHDFIMVAYSPDQEALVGRAGDILSDIDLLYAGSPGPRYFCGADFSRGELSIAVEDFAEFSDAGVVVPAPGPRSSSQA